MTASLFKQDGRGKPDEKENGKERPGSAPASDRTASRRGIGLGAGGREAGASVVAAGTEITGEVKTRGDLRIEGTVDGDVHTRGEVVISDRGSVKGEVEADAVTIEGHLEGSVTAREVARLRRGCRVLADVKSPAVELEEGSGFNGRVDMEGSSPPTGKPAREQPAKEQPAREQSAREQSTKEQPTTS